MCLEPPLSRYHKHELKIFNAVWTKRHACDKHSCFSKQDSSFFTFFSDEWSFLFRPSSLLHKCLFLLLYFAIKELDSYKLLWSTWFLCSRHFNMCMNILACFLDFNNSKSSLLGQSPKMLIESLSQTHEPQFMLAFSIVISIARRGLGLHKDNEIRQVYPLWYQLEVRICAKTQELIQTLN